MTLWYPDVFIVSVVQTVVFLLLVAAFRMPLSWRTVAFGISLVVAYRIIQWFAFGDCT